MTYSVYIVRCADGSLYVGFTKQLEQRIKDHNNGKGAFTTRKNLPVILVYKEEYQLERDALQREKQLKGWTRAKKEALIDGKLDELKNLSKRKI